MCFTLLRLPCLSALFVLGLMLRQVNGAEERHGRPIEFSDPKGPELRTNSSALNTRGGLLHDIEEDLSKFLPHTFSPNTSLDGMEAPPLQTGPNKAMLKKRKEERDRRVNWVWRNPAELTRGPTAEELFKLPDYGPDGKEKKKTTASVEGFYERLEREHQSDADSSDDDDPAQPKAKAITLDGRKPETDGKVPDQLSEGERTLRRLFDSQPSASGVTPEAIRPSASDIFGLGTPSPASPEQLESQQMLRSQFNSFFPSAAASSVIEVQSSLSGISDTPSVVVLPQMESFPTPAKSGFEPSLGVISSPFSGSGLPDFGAKDLSSSFGTPDAPTRIELPKFTAPTFDAPRRKFP